MARPSGSRTFELFKIAGVQVEIDYSWLIIFALVFWSLSASYFPVEYPGYPVIRYWVVGFVATLLFFASVLIHELSHASMANRLGANIDRITLFVFGGVAHMSGEPRSANDEIRIAAVGPLSSMVLASGFWLASKGFAVMSAPPLWMAAFRYLAFINLALALFNLLPGFPLDGGRLLRAVLWKRSGDLQRATARAADWGSGIAWGLISLGAIEIFVGALIGGLWLIFIGLFLRAAAASGYQGTVMEQVLQRLRVGDIMTREPITLTPDLSVSDAVEQYFLRFGHGGFPVVAEGGVVGLLSLSQVRDLTPAQRAQKSVSEVMRPLTDGLAIDPQASALEALHKMSEVDSGRLVVIDRDKFVGLITRGGLARFAQMKSLLEGR